MICGLTYCILLAIILSMTKILPALKKDGHRLTRQRKDILIALKTFPQSIQEIYTQVKHQHRSIDVATIYRSLEYFYSIGVVEKTMFRDGVMKYELVGKDIGHHHHLICNACGSIENIPLDEEAFFQRINIGSDFKILTHHLEFYGICKGCQKI